MGLNIKTYDRSEGKIADVLKGYWHITSTNFDGPEINCPDGYFEVIFDFITKEVDINLTRNLPSYKNIGAFVDKLFMRFTPYGLSQLTNVPQTLIKTSKLTIYELFDDNMFTDRLLKNAFSRDSIENKLIYFEDILQKKISRKETVHFCVKSLSSQILKLKGNLKINDLLPDHMISERQMENLFSKQIGLNPKAFAKVVRMGHLMTDMFVNPAVSFTELAYDYGYTDQSHFIKDFKSFFGATPTSFFKAKSGTHYC